MVVWILHVCKQTNDSSDINVIVLLVLTAVIIAINPIELSADLPLKTCDKNFSILLNIDVHISIKMVRFPPACMKNLTKPI